MRVPCAVLVALATTPGGVGAQRAIYDSGGPLPVEQAAYDVRFYDLSVAVTPAERFIEGAATVHVTAVARLRRLVLDLDTLLTVDSAMGLDGRRLDVTRTLGVVAIELGRVIDVGQSVAVTVYYHGHPLAAPHVQNSWSDGFVWTTTESGDPWVGVVSVLNGADIWWPVKDHPSDEPDSMALHVRVPEPLVVAANGRPAGVTVAQPGWRTYHWTISTPINNYGVTINVAPYRLLETSYESVTGERFPVMFWVLPNDEDAGRHLLPQFLDHLRFFEETLGPYPFRADKYGVAQTPYLGMEHQTIISYGSTFRNNQWGFDWLHFHELSHEWWANLVTARDWKDWWLHESFGTYMEALYAEQLHGEAAYHDYVPNRLGQYENRIPVAPRDARTTRDIYGGDLYGKGAAILHTLRYLIGKPALIAAFRAMVYPEGVETQGSCRCRLATTGEFVAAAERASGRDLDWFFETYLRHASLPQLTVSRANDRLTVRWETQADVPFPMPVELRVAGEPRRVDMDAGQAEIAVPPDAEVVVDPRAWILMRAPTVAERHR